jgi:hypothetical protein
MQTGKKTSLTIEELEFVINGTNETVNQNLKQRNLSYQRNSRQPLI